MGDAIFQTYLDANIILLLSGLIWMALRAILRRSAHAQDYMLQLRTAYAVMIAAALAFALGAGMGVVQNLSGVPHPHSVADLVVAHFLQGHIEMTAARFEALLTFRTQLVGDVVARATPLGALIAALVIGGAGVSVLRSAVQLVRLRGLIARSYAWREVGPVRLCLTDETWVPFSVRGLRHRIVVLPSGLLTRPHDLRIVVSHELQHARQGDLPWALAIEALRPLFFWNPVWRLWTREVERLREMACDQAVLAQRRVSVPDYAGCLLRVCHAALNKAPSAGGGLPAVAFLAAPGRAGSCADRLLKARICAMLETRRARRGADIWITVPLIAVVLVASLGVQRSGDWSYDRLMLSTIVNLERMEQRSAQASLRAALIP